MILRTQRFNKNNYFAKKIRLPNDMSIYSKGSEGTCSVLSKIQMHYFIIFQIFIIFSSTSVRKNRKLKKSIQIKIGKSQSNIIRTTTHFVCSDMMGSTGN